MTKLHFIICLCLFQFQQKKATKKTKKDNIIFFKRGVKTRNYKKEQKEKHTIFTAMCKTRKKLLNTQHFNLYFRLIFSFSYFFSLSTQFLDTSREILLLPIIFSLPMLRAINSASNRNLP